MPEGYSPELNGVEYHLDSEVIREPADECGYAGDEEVGGWSRFEFVDCRFDAFWTLEGTFLLCEILGWHS